MNSVIHLLSWQGIRRPIGIGEAARRIIAKAILHVTREDIQQAAGSLQLCAGQMAGAEAAIHGTNLAFHDQDSDAVLLVDAINAFNLLYLQAALHNIRYLCPSIATVIINTYREPTDLFVDGNSILSQEGTTQGDPLAMPMYALAILPLIRRIADNVQQAWYADDAIATGSLKNLRTWWDKLVTVGPSYGYFVNAVKTWLITKEETHTRALDIFKDTQIRITKEGKSHLRAALASRWVYVARTIPNIGHLLQPLEELLRTKFIPSLTGRAALSDLERELLALPARLGGLGLLNPSHLSTTEYSASMKVTQPLVDHIIKQDETYDYEILQDQLSAKAEVHKFK
ncbi:hypothetical protein EMCRGX_G001614 [Ephydatia muelleri]